jgi:hypothetical protein
MSLFTERVSDGRAFVHANCDAIAIASERKWPYIFGRICCYGKNKI